VNYGRDNDSYASVAGAIAGAMHGVAAIPEMWQQTVVAANPAPDMRRMAMGLTAVVAQAQEKRQRVAMVVDTLLDVTESKPDTS
jgi:hypothetical protein